MLEKQIARYERRISEEERLAVNAESREIALAHHQVAMVYRGELAIVRSRRAAQIG
jgi:hypothetical protein